MHTHVEYLKQNMKKHCAQHNFEITLFNPRDEGEGVSGVAIDCHDASAGEPVSGFAQSHEQNLIKHITMYLDPLQQHILVGNPGIQLNPINFHFPGFHRTMGGRVFSLFQNQVSKPHVPGLTQTPREHLQASDEASWRDKGKTETAWWCYEYTM